MKRILKRSLLFLSVVGSYQFAAAKETLNNQVALNDINQTEVIILLSIVALIVLMTRSTLKFQKKLMEDEKVQFDA